MSNIALYLALNLERISELLSKLKSQIFDYKGIIDPNIMIASLKELYKHKVNPDITFGELYRTRHINLICVVHNKNKNCTEYYSAKYTPDVEIAEGVVKSCALPYIFHVQYNSKAEVILDGGLSNPFPINTTVDRKEDAMCIITRMAGNYTEGVIEDIGKIVNIGIDKLIEIAINRAPSNCCVAKIMANKDDPSVGISFTLADIKECIFVGRTRAHETLRLFYENDYNRRFSDKSHDLISF